jgi:6-pyruvoyltetrahydropterin/6-carboxytetrahydropterin synthase
MRYLLTKRVRFEAAHRLPQHDGKCARLHGHSWHAEVEVAATGLHATGPKAGMAVDFGDIAAPLNQLVESHLDHHYLNESTDLIDPTSECLASWMFAWLAPRYHALGVTLTAVTIEETCTCRARIER